MNKKSYIIPSVFVYQLRYSENLLQSISGGGDDGGDGSGDAKRHTTKVIDDAEDIFDKASNYSDAVSRSPFDIE